MRPGRFDRRIAVQAPDKPGRLEILEIHTRHVPLAGDVDLEQIAASTPGATGADLALIVNEAALFAARREHERVAQADLTDAIEKTILGTERAVVMSDEDRERTAYHESGHALVGMLTPGADPVRKISIIPRGQALGVTLSTPEGDRYGYSRDELIAKIKVSLGGRAAEKVDLRRDHHGRRVRHPAADEDRARHGRALGHERRHRSPRARRGPRGRRSAAAGRLTRGPGHPGEARPRGAADRRGGRARGHRRYSSASGRAWTRSRARCSSARRSTSPRRTASRTSRPPPRSRTATASRPPAGRAAAPAPGR